MSKTRLLTQRIQVSENLEKHSPGVNAWRHRGSFLSLLAGTLLLCFNPASAQPPDLDRGRELYESNCVVCHTPKVHRRVPQLAANREHLRFIVTVWVRHESMRWSQQDIEDVVSYLERTYYLPDK